MNAELSSKHTEILFDPRLKSSHHNLPLMLGFDFGRLLPRFLVLTPLLLDLLTFVERFLN